MPELTEVQIALLATVLLAGFILGWIFRGKRTLREKKSISAGWQAQIDSQQSEHDRLANQNKSLMEQINQYQASNKDAKMRAKELSDSLKEAFERRDELQRHLKDIRGNLEVAITQRDKLQTTASDVTSREETLQRQLADRDEKVAKLKKELAGWQDRVPPLVERYRQRDLEAQQLEVELQKASDHIATLEGMAQGEDTRIEPVDSSNLPDGMDASNEPHTETSILSETAMDDDYDDAANSEDAEDTEDEDVENEATDEDTDTNDELAQNSYDENPGTDIETFNGADDEHPLGEEKDGNPGTDEFEEIASDESGSAPVDDFPNVLDDSVATGVYAHDDLKQIKGVGPAIEKTLNDLGIFRFNQIAEMSEYEIDRVAQELKGFRSRIYREDWIGQARTLQQQKADD